MAINSRQTGAIFKRRTSNTRHGVTNGNGGQTATTIEFATNCISVDFILNGRKVLSMIMEMTKKMKI
jgi:hypothetical protein